MILRSWRSWWLLAVLWPAMSGAAVIELPADGRARAIDAGEIEVLRDDTRTLDYPQVLSAEWAERFKTTAVSLNHGYDKAAWWYRAQLRAPAGDNQDWVVQLPVTSLDYVASICSTPMAACSLLPPGICVRLHPGSCASVTTQYP